MRISRASSSALVVSDWEEDAVGVVRDNQSLSVRFVGSIHGLVAVPLVDDGEARFDADENVILDGFRSQQPGFQQL